MEGTRAFLCGAVLAAAALPGCRSVDEAGLDQPPLLRLSSPETVWVGEEARAPFLIVRFGADELAIADRDAVFTLVPGTGEARRLGRACQGPGEFASVAGLGPTDDGGLVIVDGRQLRASGGCVWLRIVKDDASYDPMLEFTVPATRPAEYEWWVWDTGRDRLAGRIAVPSSFDPQLIRDGFIYGFIDQPDHTRGVARARFDAAALGTCEVP